MIAAVENGAVVALPDRGRRRMLASLAALALAPGVRAAAPDSPSLPRMQRGLNLTHWFEYERSRSVTADELRHLRELGFDHVRIPIDPAVGGWRATAGGRLGFQAELEKAVAMAVGAGLEVVVDLHWSPEVKAQIENRRDDEDAVTLLWVQLAVALVDTPVERVAFELFNEPQYYTPQPSRWPAVQRRLLRAVRAVAPRHLLLLTGPRGSSFDALAELVPEPDDRVAYVFHDYEPFLFTHQGASWLDERYATAGLRSDIRYPSDAQAGVTPGLAHPHPRAARDLADYLEGGWNAQRIRARIDRAGAWAREHQVRVVCNEFGVIRRHVDPASRYRWIGDTRCALEANRIGWTLWDYCDIFGIVADGTAGSGRVIEPAALAALGLGAGPSGTVPR